MDITIENVLVSVADKEHEDFEHLIDTLVECNPNVNFYTTKGTGEAIQNWRIKIKEVLRGYKVKGNLVYKLIDSRTIGFRKTDVIFDLAIIGPKPLGESLFKRKLAGEEIKPGSPVMDNGGFSIILYAYESLRTTILTTPEDYHFFVKELKDTKGKITDRMRDRYNDVAYDGLFQMLSEARLYKTWVYGDK